MLSNLLPSFNISLNAPRLSVIPLILNLTSDINNIFIGYLRKEEGNKNQNNTRVSLLVKKMATESTKKAMKIMHFGNRIQAAMLDNDVYDSFMFDYRDFRESFGENFDSLRHGITPNMVSEVYSRLDDYLDMVFKTYFDAFGRAFGVLTMKEMDGVVSDYKVALYSMAQIVSNHFSSGYAENNKLIKKNTQTIKRFIEKNRNNCEFDDIASAFMTSNTIDPVVGKWMLLEDLLLCLRNNLSVTSSPDFTRQTPIRIINGYQDILLGFINKAKQLGL